jgi:hypothetical protein
MAKKKATQGVRLDPNLPLVPGNSVSFVTDVPENGDRFSVKISNDRGTTLNNISSTGGDLRIGRIVESGWGTTTVEFYADGKKFAEGSF